MPDSFKVEGAKELSKKLHALGALEGGKVLKASANLAVSPVVKTAKATAPIRQKGGLVKTYKGRLVAPGFLSRSVAKRTRLGRTKSIAWADVGVKPEAYYGLLFVELGTSKQPKQPWLVPAFRAHRQETTAKLGAGIKRKILLLAKKRGAT